MKKIILAALAALLSFTAGAQLVGPNPFTPAGPQVTPAGGSGLVFDAPLTTSLVPRRGGAATFTRATTASVIDHEGIIRYVKSGEARFQGARRVENLLPSAFTNANTTKTATFLAEGLSDPYGGNTASRFRFTGGASQYVRHATGANLGYAGWSVRRSIWMRAASGYNGAKIRLYNEITGGSFSQQGVVIVTLTETWKRYSANLMISSTGTTFNDTLYSFSADNATDVEIEFAYGQVEDVTGQANTNPSEVVSNGELSSPFHGANVDGVKYFDTLNGNTVDGSGVVTEATGASLSAITNILPRSEEFNDSLWVKGGSSVTANSTAAPTGASTADTLTEDSSGSVHRVTRTLTVTSGSPLCFSAYAKTNGRDAELALLKFGTGDYVSYRVALASLTPTANHSLGSTWSSPSISVQDVGNDWRRIMMCANATGMTSVQAIVGLVNGGSNSYTGNGTSGAYIWGAQVTETTSTVPYIATTSAAASRDFLLGYQHEGGIDTNLAIRSEVFGPTASSYWVAGLTSVSSDSTAGPDGRTTADKIFADAASGRHSHRTGTIAFTNNQPATFSVYIKNAGVQYVHLRINDTLSNANSADMVVDTNAWTISGAATARGTYSNASGSITPMANGWYRAILTATVSPAASYCKVELSTDGGRGADGQATVFTGDGTSGVYAFGAQAEAVGRASSYIPTTTATVQRFTDDLKFPYPSGLVSAISAFAEVTKADSLQFGAIMLLSNGTSANRLDLGWQTTNGRPRFTVGSGGVTQADITSDGGTLTVGGAINKIAFVAKDNYFRHFANGTASGLDSVGSMPTGMNQFELGDRDFSGAAIYGTLRNVKLWKKALPDATLQTMTQ